MAVHFSESRMREVLSSHESWWRGELPRPLVKVTLRDVYPGRSAAAPVLSQRNCHLLTWSPEQVVEALDADLSRHEYLGDAFPMVNFDAFGPGVLSAFCGARLENASGNVWFFSEKALPIEEIHPVYDPHSLWAERIKALYRAGRACWGRSVVMGMPDLGGLLDAAAIFRGSENLLMDLVDAPEEVLRLCGEVQAAWYAAYEDLHAAMGEEALYTDWCGLLSGRPSYVLQCDFSYMIGNAMFRAFGLPFLREDTRRLTHSIYHLDGIGALKHLDTLLAIPELNAVQWVYGDGQPSAIHWLAVYERIAAAGKQMMVIGTPEDFLAVMGALHGTPYTAHTLPAEASALAERLIRIR